MKTIFLSTVLSTFLSLAAFGPLAQAEDTHPCAEIKKACETAGFVKGQAKAGTGLWLDCVDPIIQGKTQPANAKLKLPTVDAKLIASCKEKHAKWGEGHAK